MSIQRQLSAPADVGLQRQVSQDMPFQRQMSTPTPQDISQQPQQFSANQQFQQGQF